MTAHIPCWSVGSYNCPASDFSKLMLTKHVDLVLNGHEHAYMRTHQLASGVSGCATVPTGSYNAACVRDRDGSFAASAGTVFATIMRGFGVELLGYDPYPSEGMRELGGTYVDLSELFGRADIIALHAPLTPETYHLVNRERLGLVTPGVMMPCTANGVCAGGACAAPSCSVSRALWKRSSSISMMCGCRCSFLTGRPEDET